MLENLDIIETTNGRQFKPWVTEDKLTEIVANPDSVIAIASEMTGSKKLLVNAINAKGGQASLNQSYSELAEDIENISPNVLFQGMTVSAPIQMLNFMCDKSAGGDRQKLLAIDNNTLTDLNVGECFNNCVNLNSVKFDSVTSVSGATIFYGCTNLESANFPQLTQISGGSMFNGLTSLKTVNMPELITISGGYVFYNCTGLTSINMPKLKTLSNIQIFRGIGQVDINFPALETISVNDTFNASQIKSVNMPALTTITGASTFYSNYYLTSVNMPELTNINSSGTFTNCSSLITLNLPKLQSINGSTTFLSVSALVTLNLPELTQIVGNNTFQQMYSLKTLYMPKLSYLSGLQTLRQVNYLEDLTVGTLAGSYDMLYDVKHWLKNITIGADTNVDLQFQQWAATEVIARGEIGVIETNIMNNIVPNLYLNGNHIIRFHATLYDNLSQNVKDAIINRGWTVQRG